MLSHQEFTFYITILSVILKKKMALLASPDNDYKADFLLGEEGQLADEFPIVNIIQNEDKFDIKMSAYLSNEPSELELGAIWQTLKINKVFFMDLKNPNVLKFYTVSNAGMELHEIKLTDNLNGYQAALEYPESYVQKIEDQEPRLKKARYIPATSRASSSLITSALSKCLLKREVIDDFREERKINEDFMRIAYELVYRSWNGKSCDEKIEHNKFDHGYNIGAIIVNDENKIIAWGLNYRNINRTFHAEMIMIQHYLRANQVDKLPDSCRIYSTLQPCFMCAGYIADVGKNIKVFYGINDPFFSGKTALEQGKNGCSERPSTLPYVDYCGQMIGDQNIIDFLFGMHPKNEKKKMPTKDMFARGFRDLSLFHELRLSVKMRSGEKLNKSDPIESKVLSEGRAFLSELDEYVFDASPSQARR